MNRPKIGQIYPLNRYDFMETFDFINFSHFNSLINVLFINIV